MTVTKKDVTNVEKQSILRSSEDFRKLGNLVTTVSTKRRIRGMLRTVDPTEHQIQCAIVEWSNNVFFDHPLGGKCLLRPHVIKITNEGKRSWAQGKKMKSEGLTKGVSDLLVAVPTYKQSMVSPSMNMEKAGFWLELKAPGKKPTESQIEFICAMRGVGYHADWKDSVDGGIQALKDYLGMR